jgi:DeoR/GlpR family transcriptional regulator of sugar metabolism
MLIEERRATIVGWLSREGYLSVHELSQRLHVSTMTIWRDLQVLEGQGLVARVRGGAAPPHQGEGEERPTGHPIRSYEIDPAVFHPRKATIGAFAARHLVGPGDSITLEAGTTVTAMLPHLEAPDLTILTNGINALLIAINRGLQATVLCSGGILNEETGAFVGPQAEAFFANFRVSRAFVSAGGLTLEDGFTDPSPFYVRLKDVMRQHAEQTVMLLDSSKIGQRTLTQVAGFADVDILVTDQDASPAFLDGLAERGVEVYVAE